MHAKDEFLFASESMLVASECAHILNHGIHKWKSGALARSSLYVDLTCRRSET